jgi:hypothetical protein
MLQLYRGSGSGEIEFLRIEAEPEQWLTLRDTAMRLLRERGNARAAELLYVFPWEIWQATNSFNDEFHVLYFSTTPEEYVRFEGFKTSDRHEFRAMAEAVAEVSSFYIRFITVGVKPSSSPEESAHVESAAEQRSEAMAAERPIPDNEMPATFDVAISFAGSERQHAQQLAIALRDRALPFSTTTSTPTIFGDVIWRRSSTTCFESAPGTASCSCHGSMQSACGRHTNEKAPWHEP